MGEACTQLELNIISAQDLQEKNFLGRMQTYGVAWIEFEKKLTTQIDRTGGANPTWNDKLIFRVEERFLRSETSALTVEIYCVGCFRDTLLGTVRVLLSNFVKGYGGKDFSGMSFSALQVRRPSSRPQGILNLGTMILGGIDLVRMNRFSPSSKGGVGYRDLMGISVDKILSIKANNIDAQEQQSGYQDFNKIPCKEEGTDQDKQNGGDEIFEKETVGCYRFLMAPKLKRNKVDAQEKQSRCQEFNKIPCKEECTDQDKQNVGDEIFEKKAVGWYHILMAPKLKRNKVDAQEKQSRCQEFNKIPCKEDGTDQEKQNGGDEIFQKKAVGCYHILLAPKLKKNKVGLGDKPVAVHAYYYYQ